MRARNPAEAGKHRKTAPSILYRPDWDRVASELEASRELIDHIGVTLDDASESLNKTLGTAREIVEVLQ